MNVRRAQIIAFLVCTVLVVHVCRGSGPVCSPFCDGLQDVPSVSANGGSISGLVTFAPAINSNGASFGGAGSISYQDAMFAASRGSLAFWFRKNSADVSGGIAQLGTIGQANSIGLFYNSQSTLFLEARNGAAEYAAVSVADVLSESVWTHIVAAWDRQTDGMDMWLFIDGRYSGYTYLPGPSAAPDRLDLGVTGYYGEGEGTVDEARFMNWNLADSEVYAEFVTSANRQRRQPGSKPVSTGNVALVDGALYVEGRPFRVKGVGYQPVPIGASPSRAVLDYIYTDSAILSRDLTLLRAMNVNTIRLWSEAPDTTLLNACYNGGVDPIYVIMGFWVPQWTGIDYADPTLRASIELDFRDYVSQFRDHPAVLAWGIGNENNLNYTGDMADWYSLANDLAAAAYDVEGAAYHPCVIVNGALLHLGDSAAGSDDISLDAVDMWGVNLYFGYDAHAHFDYYDALSAKPLVFTEYGIDAWDNVAGVEYQSVHADYLVHQWRQIESRCLGASLMAYSDEWWKAGTPTVHDYGGYGTSIYMHPDMFSNEEWWGIVAPIDAGAGPDVMQPRSAYYALGAEYRDITGDYDGDDDVDVADFAAFQSCYGTSPSSTCRDAFDFVADGVIDTLDYEAFSRCFNGVAVIAACAP